MLIVANSARMLAQFARLAGFSSLVIDCFADQDTQELVLELVKVDSLVMAEVKQAVSILNQRHRMTHLIYGTGFESNLSTLEYLEQNFTVLGNPFDIFSLVQNKTYFFLKLKQLQIPFPETIFQAPDEQADWLTKPLAGEGGIGIRRYNKELKKIDSCYWQKLCTGIPSSVLFVANGRDYKIIGLHKQFVTQINEDDFVFSGLINQLEINESIVQNLRNILDKLVLAFSLRGINSLDFIISNKQCFVLEINARPSASLNLYPSDLLLMHINSCLTAEELPLVKALTSYQAYKIIFAETNMTISNAIFWPSWVVDRPQQGSIINTGMPICSIIAGGKNEQQVENLLLSRQQQLTKLLR